MTRGLPSNLEPLEHVQYRNLNTNRQSNNQSKHFKTNNQQQVNVFPNDHKIAQSFNLSNLDHRPYIHSES